MTIPVSTVPAVKSYLFAAITTAATAPAAPTGERLLVCYDEPGPDEPGDIISVGDITNRQIDTLAMVGDGGQHWLTERYSIDVIVDIFRSGDFARTVYERAWTLASVIETVVRTDPGMGGLVIEAKPGETRTESAWDAEHRGRRTRLTLAVDVFAEL